ncbi:hypothetical protein [Streptomyces sp. 3214.6]|uniref:hypothetical protein n=1 Tax=Streptomyces sp. 3214.6 TaxID=1882757 RepID=UPI00090A2B11|nr:hypothetical protein [Streptomyces sp. 3214.6]SHI25247.1 hypothetical protein SAMN05444521_6207 [Streptomyces sp. 3214.6]
MPAATEAGPELESYMSRMPRRLTLRFAVLTAVAASALLAPAGAALADGPTPSASAVMGTDDSDAAKEKEDLAKKLEEDAAQKRKAAAVDEARKGEAEKRMPRGGVDAGEAVVEDGGTSTTALAGSAAGALLLAGAGTVVIRRRAAGRREG